MKPKRFATEADLCASFLRWLKKERHDLRAYAEWAGWDILVAFPEGWQLGIQAKLRLNAEVLLQAAPEFRWGAQVVGPDFRGVLVPETNPLSGLAARLGLVVFCPRSGYPRDRDDFFPDVNPKYDLRPGFSEADWLDWNPTQRHGLPPTETDAVAGSPCPVSLTPWKLGALAVLAELEVRGTITTKRMRELGINASRWTTGRWLEPVGERGLWKRGAACPAFDEQHPTAYAHALEKARQQAAAKSEGVA